MLSIIILNWTLSMCLYINASYVCVYSRNTDSVRSVSRLGPQRRTIRCLLHDNGETFAHPETVWIGKLHAQVSHTHLARLATPTWLG